MKIPFQPSRRSRDGMAVIAVIAILSIILIFVAGKPTHLAPAPQRLEAHRKTADKIASRAVA